MAKSHNQVIYSTDLAHLQALQEDFTMIGRRNVLDVKEGKLTVFAMPNTWKRKEQKESRQRRRKEESQTDLY